MPRTPKPKPVLIIDTRERIPWDFDGDDKFDSIVHEKLDVGDYSIKGLEHLVCIERKVGCDELYTNLTGKPASRYKERLYREIERMQDHKVKVIIIEQSCDDIMNPNLYYVNKKKINRKSPFVPPAVVITNLTDIMVRYGVHILFGGHKAQSMAKGILLKAHELYLKGELE